MLTGSRNNLRGYITITSAWLQEQFAQLGVYDAALFVLSPSSPFPIARSESSRSGWERELDVRPALWPGLALLRCDLWWNFASYFGSHHRFLFVSAHDTKSD